MKPKRFNNSIKARALKLPAKAPTITTLMATLSGLLNGRKLDASDFKARRLTVNERYALRLQDVGVTKRFNVMPPFIPKTVTDDQCDLCGQMLPEDTVQCFRCGNCVFCGAYNDDHYQNACIACGNNAPGRTDDTDVVLNVDAR